MGLMERKLGRSGARHGGAWRHVQQAQCAQLAAYIALLKNGLDRTCLAICNTVSCALDFRQAAA